MLTRFWAFFRRRMDTWLVKSLIIFTSVEGHQNVNYKFACFNRSFKFYDLHQIYKKKFDEISHGKVKATFYGYHKNLKQICFKSFHIINKVWKVLLLNLHQINFCLMLYLTSKKPKKTFKKRHRRIKAIFSGSNYFLFNFHIFLLCTC